MTLLEFLTYCQLKGYVADHHGKEVLLANPDTGMGAGVLLDDDNDDENVYNMIDYVTRERWTAENLNELIAEIAPELT